MKTAFAAEELLSSVTSGYHHHQLEESSTAVDIRNARFVWPHGHRGVINADIAGWYCRPTLCLQKVHPFIFVVVITRSNVDRF